MSKSLFTPLQSEKDAAASHEYIQRQARALQSMSRVDQYRKDAVMRQIAANEDYVLGVGHCLFKGRKPRSIVEFDVEPTIDLNK